MYFEAIGASSGPENGDTSKPGLSLTFSVDSTFQDPLFLVTCDRPCTPSGVMLTDNDTAVGGGNMTGSLLETKDPKVVGIGTGNRKWLYPGTKVTIFVRSRDDQPLASATVNAYER